MKDYKWGKCIGILILCAIGGGFIGGGLQWVLGVLKIEEIKTLFNQFAPNLFIIASICGIIGLAGYFHFNRLLKKDEYSNEEGSLYERYENKIGIVMTLSTICGILNFTAFGLNLTSVIGRAFLALFLLNVILAFAGEVANIALIKKVRPELNADPVSPGFKESYFDKLDEMEKVKTGRISFKTMSNMVLVYVIMLVICWVLVISFEVSTIICLPVGLLWLTQTILSLYHSCRYK